MGKAVEIVKKLSAVTFNWKDTNEPDMGLIAEDVAKVFPESVWYKDGKIEGLKPLALIALLVEAVKELEQEKKEK